MYNENINTYKLKRIIKEQNLFHDSKNIYSIGIDQGYANLGFAVIRYNVHTDKYSVLEFGTIITNSKDEIQNRLNVIYDKMEEVVNKYSIDMMSCERLFVNSGRNANGDKIRNKSSAIVRTNMSTGIIYLLAAKHNILIRDFPPTTVKKQLTGSGKADKEEIIKVVEDLMKKQGLTVKTNHESDAIAIGITGISSYIEKLLD